MEWQPLVSVIIPVYNVEDYLVETLESVVNQSYTNLEIILIDDGSTDGSGEICDRYAAQDKRIRLIHNPNYGVSVTRNLGLETATGEVIAFLDSDDAYDPDYFSLMLNEMNNTGADGVICKYTIRATTGKLPSVESEKTGPMIDGGVYERKHAASLLAANTIHAYLWNKLFRAGLWKDVRFPVGMVYEDIDAVFHIFYLCESVAVLDRQLYLYRKRPGSITEQKTAKSISDWLSICFRVEAFVGGNIPDPFSDEDLKTMKQTRLRHMISYYLHFLPKKGNASKSFIKDFRKQIIQLKKEVGLSTCTFVMKICYWIIYICPWLLKILSPIYLAIKKPRNKH